MGLQLPAHLQGRTNRQIAVTSSAVVGAALPPHISIRGNTFTLVDAAGNEYNAGPVLDVVIADSSGKPPPKRYYKDKWTPDSNEPPTCWSSDGVTPDRSVPTPQSPTCGSCQLNARGSKISEISGAAIKACRDEIWLAILLPQYPTMLFQLVITPGSFQNWGLFTKYFEHGVDISDVITRIGFQPQVSGVLTFEISGYAQNNPQYISNAILNVLQAAWNENKTDVLTGRGGLALESPQAQPQIEHQQPTPFVPTAALPAATPSFVPQGQPLAVTMPLMQTAPATATTASPSRRRRNTQAPASQPNGPQQAPFMPQNIQAPTPQNPAPFGIQQGAQPNLDLQNTLDNLFGKK